MYAETRTLPPASTRASRRKSQQTCRIWPPPSVSAKMIESVQTALPLVRQQRLGAPFSPQVFQSETRTWSVSQPLTPSYLPVLLAGCSSALFKCPCASGAGGAPTASRHARGSTGDVPRSDDGLFPQLLAGRPRGAAETARRGRGHAGAAKGGNAAGRPAGHGETERDLRRRSGHRSHRRRRIYRSGFVEP